MRLRRETVLTIFFILFAVQADAQKGESACTIPSSHFSKAVAVFQPRLLEVKVSNNYPNDNIYYVLKRGTTMIINKMTYETETEWVQFGKA